MMPSPVSQTPSSARGSSSRRANAAVHHPAMSPPSARRSSLPLPLSSRRASRTFSESSFSRSQRGGDETPTRRRITSASARRGSLAESLSMTQSQGNAMKVFVRVRPYSEREISQTVSTHSTVRIDSDNPTMITLLEPSRDFRPLVTYSFARCFWSVFSKSNDIATNQSMADLRESVDVHLNSGAINSARRPRTLSTTATQDKMSMSFRGRREMLKADAEAASTSPYQGAGSGATVVDGSVTHPPYASQGEVFEHVGKPILDNTLEGYNGCVFAYGQTGSGKTFTMMGFAPGAADIRRRRESAAAEAASGATTPRGMGGLPSFASQSDTTEMENATANNSPAALHLVGEEDDDTCDVVNKSEMDANDLQGIIPRISAQLFSGLRAKREKDASCSYRVEVAYYEIYNERVFDLIKPQRNNELKIRHNPTTGPYVEGLYSKMVDKEEDVARVLRKGIQERHTAQTKFNDHSSRSHSILSFNIVQLFLDGSDNSCKMQSKLNLVDLAGSERAGAAGVDRPEYEEGVKINLSLTVLGRVIDCLADLSQNKSLAVPVPYRDSNLTWLLMDSIGGNSQTAMIATISPHMINYEEMRQTIRYASRAKQILNRAVINEDPQVRQIKLLTGEVERLQQLLKEAGASEYTNEYVKGLEKRIRQLEKRVSDQEMIIAGLRAELERAGIDDPTLEDGYGETLSPAKAGQNEIAALQKRLERAQEENVNLKAQLESRPTVDPVAIEKLKNQLAEQQKEMKQLQKELRRRTRGQNIGDRAGSDLNAVMQLVDEKEAVLFRCMRTMVKDFDAELKRLKREHNDDFAELKKFHEDELEEQAKEFHTKLSDARHNDSRQEQLLEEKHKAALKQLEDALQRSRELADEDRRQMESEREAIRKHSMEAQERLREQYQQDLEKMRMRLEEAADRQRNGDQARQMNDSHAKELERKNEEIERMRRLSDSEIARLRNQLENEALRRQSDLMEKDRQRRAVEHEMGDLRREMLKLESEKNKLDKNYQEQIRELMIQQENLINVSNSLLSDWENKSSDMESGMCKLRALIYDQDYMTFRQKMREMAFAERTDISEQLQKVEDRARRDAELLLNIATKARRAQEDQDKSLRRYQKDLEIRRQNRQPGEVTPPVDLPLNNYRSDTDGKRIHNGNSNSSSNGLGDGDENRRNTPVNGTIKIA